MRKVVQVVLLGDPWHLGVLTGLLLVVSLAALTSAFAAGVGALRRPRRALT